MLRLWLVGYQRVQAVAVAAIRRSADTPTAATGVSWGGGGLMTAPVTASERDLPALARIVSEDRPDLPADGGLPESLLADLMSQIRCDVVVFQGFDSGRQTHWFVQEIPSTLGSEDLNRTYWQQYRDSQFDMYPIHTGDLRSVIKPADFYSARQWHSTAMYTDFDRLMGIKHCLMLCLPEAPPSTAGPGRHVRLTLTAGPGRTSPSGTARCSRCCAPTCTRPTSTPNAAATPSPRSPRGTGTC